MSNRAQRELSRRKAIGTTFAATPPIKQMYEEALQRKEEGWSDERLHEWLRDRAFDDNLLGLRAFLGINRQFAKMPFRVAAAAIAQHYATKLANKRVQDVIRDWAIKNGGALWVADFIMDWLNEDEPPAIRQTLVRVVGDFDLGPDDDKTKVVFVMANSLCDPHQVAAEFLNKCAQVFPPETFMAKGVAERDARRFAAFADKRSDFDIAKEELAAEGIDSRTLSKQERNEEVKTRANSILKSRKRWDEYVTNILEPVSRNSD